MSDAPEAGAEGGAPPVAPPPQEPGKRVSTDDMPPEALSARLEREAKKATDAATRAIADKLGMPIEQAAAMIAKAKELEDAQKSETQRLQEQLAALTPRATERDRMFDRLKELADLQYGELGDDHKAVVDDLSSADDPDTRIKVIASLKRRGITGKAPPTPTLPDGANTSKAPTGPKPPDAAEGSPEFHFQKWQSMPSLLRAAYFDSHADLITKADAYTKSA
jgi:hypothetical protein